jgi:DNA-binding NarL/FixJ family response regulator
VPEDANSKIRIVVSDDSVVVREGLRSILAEEPDFELVGICGDGHAAERCVALEHPDVVIADLRMPPSGNREGIRLASRLREDAPGVGVVILSQHIEGDYAVELFELGSSRRAYLLKDRLGDRTQLVAAVRSVSDGGSAVDPEVVDALVSARAREALSPIAALTPREREILALIAEGHSNAAIARRLVLTKRAVEKHVNAIFGKLQLSDPLEVSRRVRAALLYLTAQPSHPPQPR